MGILGTDKMFKCLSVIFLVLVSSVAIAREANFVELEMSCEGLKNKPNQKAYSTNFNGIISGDGLSFVAHETWKQGTNEFNAKQFTGLMDFDKRTAHIKGTGRSNRSKNTWSLYFKSTKINSFREALGGPGMKGREGDGDWKKPCTLRLVKSTPISNTDLKSKLKALDESLKSNKTKLTKKSKEASSLQANLNVRIKEINELKKQVKEREKKFTNAMLEIDELKDNIKKKNENIADSNAAQLQDATEKIAKLQSDLLIANKQIKSLTQTIQDSGTVSQKPISWANFQSQIEIQQRQFCSLAEDFYYKLKEAKTTKNEIKVNVVFMERQEDIDALIPQGNFSNWIFEVVKIDQVPDGSAAVILKLQCDTTVGSGYLDELTAAGEDGWRATIPYNDRRYRELAKLSAGQFVTASGKFLEVDKFKPGQPETFYASMPIGNHPLVKNMGLKGELFVADFSYIAALNN